MFLNLQNKKIIEVGCRDGSVTEILYKNKDVLQYSDYLGIEKDYFNLNISKKKFTSLKYSSDYLTLDNLIKYLNYDCFLFFYTSNVCSFNFLMFLNKLINYYEKEAIVYFPTTDLANIINIPDMAYQNIYFLNKTKTDYLVDRFNFKIFKYFFKTCEQNKFYILTKKSTN